MKKYKYRVIWWEEHIITKQVDIDATDKLEAQDKAMNNDVADNKVYSELREITDSGHIKTTLLEKE